MTKQYAERDAFELDQAGGHYMRHVMAMTSEQLHSKSDIAAELAWRDSQIAALQQKLDAMAAENAALKQVFVSKEFSTEVTDVFLDTVVLKIDGDEHYCHQWVDNDSDVIRAVLTSIKAENPTPATDAYMNSVRAEGVRLPLNKYAPYMIASSEASQFAAQIRSGTHDTEDKAG